MNTTKSHVVILNRTGTIATDGWIHIVPKGELANREAGIVQVLDDQSLDAIMSSIDADRQRQGVHWPGIYAGREHFIYDADKDSAALAWFRDFEKRDNGIWAKEDGLTPMGQTAVKNKEYKFTSFTADRADLQKIDGNRYRITKLDTVGFTNQANGKELLTPITNRDNFAEGSPSAANQHKPNQAKTMKNVAIKLGLAAEASEDAVLEAVTKIINRADSAAADVVKLTNRLTPLETENQTLLGEQVEALLDAHKVTDAKVRNQAKPVLLKLTNRAERVGFLEDFGFKAGKGQAAAEADKTRVLNRGGGAVPETTPDEEAEQKQAGKIMNRAREIVKETPTIQLAVAVGMAKREIV